MITRLSILAIIAYLVTWMLIVIRVRGLFSQYKHKQRIYLKLIWGFALLMQAVSLYTPLILQSGLSLDLVSAASHVLWLISLLIFYTTFRYKIETLALFVIPLVILSIIMRLLSDNWQVTSLSGGLGIHIFISLLAYSILFFATVQASLLAYQHCRLHKHRTGGLIRSLPALDDMEALLFRLITVGVILLSAGLLSGFVYLNDFFQQEVAHKIIFSVIAWLLFASLLFKRYCYGCRARMATRWTLFASGFLFLAYFGSKFVFEYLLN
jgi:ABC-type uncharacterized transport system permease subunit